MGNTKIELDKEFYIEKDTLNWMLKYKKQGINPETKKPYTTSNTWYLPNLRSALKSYVNKAMLSTGNLNNFTDVLQKLNEIEENIGKATIEDKALVN